MSTLVSALVHLALLVVAFRLWRWARRRARAARSTWRRRCGLLLFLFPVILWLAGALLPAELQGAVALLGLLNTKLDAALVWSLGVAEQSLEGTLGLVAKPLIQALFYGGLGFLVGWPLDRWRRAKEAPAADSATATEEGQA